MDWNLVIHGNREALKRILAMLVAMAGLDATPPFSARGRGWPSEARSDEGCCEERQPATLPRRLHCAVLRLLRPAEAAARRLIVVAAREIVVDLPPLRPRKVEPDRKAAHAALRSLGIAVVLSPADVARAAAEKRAAEKRAARGGRQPALPLFDPQRHPFRPRVRTVPPHAAPRILFFDGAAPYRLPSRPSPHDLIDATRLARRFAALARALDDLPGHARRFACWKARRDAARAQPALASQAGRGGGNMRRIWPLRFGRPPGQQPRNVRRAAHEVYDVLADLQYFAQEALKAPDTS